MAKTMTKWKWAAIASEMTIMMRAFVELLRQRCIVVGGVHMTTRSSDVQVDVVSRTTLMRLLRVSNQNVMAKDAYDRDGSNNNG